MSKIKLTGTELSSSLNSTGSFGRADIGAINIDVNSGQGQIGMSSDAQRLFLWGGSNRAAGNGAYIQMDGTNLGGSLNLFAGGATGSVQVLGNLSGSLGQTGSFSAIFVESAENGTTIQSDEFGLRINSTQGWYGLQVESAYENPLRVRSTDSTGGIDIGDNNSTNNYNRIQVVGNDRMEFYVNNVEMMELQTGEITINQGGANINTRIEGDNQENLVFIDAGKNAVGIGKAMNVGDEKLYVGGDVGITGSLHVSGNISTSGSIIAKEFRTEFVNQIIATSSGSTTFGDTPADDTHRFTGSLQVSGAFPNLTFPAVHSADKIRLYSGGSERIGTSAHQLIYTATSHSFKDTDGHENFKIGPTGNAELLATGKLYFDGGTHTYIHESANDQLDFYVGGQKMLRLYEGGTDYVHVDDNTRLGVGNDPDFTIHHDATNTNLLNITGDLYIENQANDRDIILRSDDGSGGVTAYLTLDGGEKRTHFYEQVRVADSKQFAIGNGDDLEIIHDGSHNYMKLNNGNLYFRDQSDNNIFQIYREGGGIQLSEGDLKIPATSKIYFDGGSHTYIAESSADIMDFTVGGDLMLRLDEAGGQVKFPQDDVLVSGSYVWSTGGQGGSTDNVVVQQYGAMIDSPNNPLIRFYADDNLDLIEYNMLRYSAKHRFTRGSAAGGRVKMMTVQGNSTTEFKLWHQSNNVGGGNTTGSAVIYLNATTGSGQSYINSGGGLSIATGSVIIGGTSATNSKLNVKSEGSTQSVIRIDGDDGRGANRYALDIVDDDTNSRGSVRVSTTSGPSIVTTGDISGSIGSTGSFGIVEIGNTPGGDSFVLGHPPNKARLNYSSAVFTFLDADNSYGSIAAESGSFYGNVGIRATKGLYFDDGEAPVAGHTYIAETSDDRLDFYVGGDLLFRIDEAGTTVGMPADSDQATFRIGAGSDLGLYVNTDDSAVIRHFTQDKDLYFYVNDGGVAVKAMQIDASNSGSLLLQNDLQYISIGAGLDGNIYVYNDDFYISNFTAGKDTVFQYLKSDSSAYISAIKIDASAERIVFGAVDVSIPVAQKLYFGGGDHTYITEDADDRLRFFTGGAEFMRFTEASDNSLNIYEDVYISDDKKIHFGAGNDIKIYHNAGGNSNFENHSGDLYFTQYTDDGDIFFRTDNGSGGVANYIQIDGGSEYVYFHKDIALKAAEKLYLDGGGNTYIHEQSADDLEIVVGGDVLAKFENDTIVLGGGYAISSSLAFFGQPESPKHMAYGEFTVASEGWHRLARCGTVADGAGNGTRASAKFTVYDTDSSRHSAVTFYASGHFGQNFNIRVINSSDYGGTHGVIEQIRIVHGSTYEGFGVDVYVKNSGDSAVRYVMEENYQDNGWTPENFAAVAADPPTNMVATAISCSYASSNVVDGLAHGNGTVNGAVRWYRTENGVNFQSGSGGYAELKTNSRYRVVTDSGYAEIGPQNSSWNHMLTDRPGNYFNAKIAVDGGIIESYDEDLSLRRAGSTDDRITIEASTHRFTVDAVDRAVLTSAGLQLDQNIRVGNGSEGTPSISFGNDTDSGIYRRAANQVGIVCAGEDQVYVSDGTINIEQPVKFQFANDQRIYDNGSGGLRVGAASHELELYCGGSDPMKFITGGISGNERLRLETAGDLHCDGDVIAASTTISDKRLKDNVETIPNALDKVKELRGVSFDWNKGGRKGQKDIGLIAQEVEKVLPELVREKKMALIDDKEYLTVDYDKMVAVLVEAVKQQQVQIDELKTKLGDK